MGDEFVLGEAEQDAAWVLRAALEGQEPDEDGDIAWWAPDSMTTFEKELERELGPGHPLAGKRMRAVAKSDCADDVLFFGEGAFFSVHLTYSGKNVLPFPLYERILSAELADYFASYRPVR